MTENEINILRILYRDPNQVNNTIQSIATELGIQESVCSESVKSLIDYGYALYSPAENQKGNLTAYKITVNGAKKIIEIDNKSTFGSFINNYGKRIALFIAFLGLVGIGYQIYFGYKEDSWHSKQYQLQQQQYQNDSLNKVIYSKSFPKDTCR